MPQASLPSPRTWSAGDYVTVPRLRADAVNAIAYLRQRPWFAGQRTDGHSMPSGTDTPLTLDTELADPWNGHQPGAAAWYAQVPGWYLVRSCATWNYTSTTPVVLAGSMSGVTGGTAWGPVRGPNMLCGSGWPPVTQAVSLIEMTATGPAGGGGDYVQFSAWNDSAAAISLQSASVQYPTGSVRWVCATSGTQPLPVPPLTTVPSPITRAWLNANVRDTIEQLIYPPVCKAAYAAGSSSMASSTFPAGVTVPLNSVAVDNYGGFNATTHLYTAPVSGRYLVYGQFNLNGSSTTTGYGCGISISGGTTMWGDNAYFAPSGSQFGGAAFSRRVRLTAGQTVALIGCQGSGSAITYQTSPVNPTHMIIVWEGT